MMRTHPSQSLAAILDEMAPLAQKLRAWRTIVEELLMCIGRFHRLTIPLKPESKDFVQLRHWQRERARIRGENDSRLESLLYAWTVMQRVRSEEPKDPDAPSWTRDIEAFVAKQYELHPDPDTEKRWYNTRDEIPYDPRKHYGHLRSAADIRAFVREMGGKS